MAKRAKAVGFGSIMLVLVVAGAAAGGSTSSGFTGTVEGVVLRDGAEIRLGQDFAAIGERFSPRGPLFQANDNPSLLLGVADGLVAAVVSTGSGGVSVPGFRFGMRFQSLATSPAGMVATDFEGRPAMRAERGDVHFIAVALPHHQSCEFRPTASQVVIATSEGEALVRQFLAEESPCVAGQSKAGLA